MDLFAVITITASLIEWVFKLSQYILQLQAYHGYTISQTYEPTAGLLISICFRSNASEYERLQRVVLRGSDEETLRFRAAVTNECNMTAVAVRVMIRTKLDPI